VIDFSGNAYIWDIGTRRIVVASTTEPPGLAAFGLGAKYAALSGKGGALQVWNADAARTLLNLRGSSSAPVSAMLWSGQRLFVGDESGALSVYSLGELTQSISDLVARTCQRPLSPHFTWVESAGV
jgi:hypothetical protein